MDAELAELRRKLAASPWDEELRERLQRAERRAVHVCEFIRTATNNAPLGHVLHDADLPASVSSLMASYTQSENCCNIRLTLQQLSADGSRAIRTEQTIVRKAGAGVDDRIRRGTLSMVLRLAMQIIRSVDRPDDEPCGCGPHGFPSTLALRRGGLESYKVCQFCGRERLGSVGRVQRWLEVSGTAHLPSSEEIAEAEAQMARFQADKGTPL